MALLDLPILKRLYPSLARRFLILINKNKLKHKLGDFVFNIDIKDSIERTTFFRRDYEKSRIEFLSECSKKFETKIFLDIGAYIGYYSILMSPLFEQIYSFEPQLLKFNCLNDNISDNNLNNKIKTFNIGLGEKNEERLGGAVHQKKLYRSSGFHINSSGSEKVKIIKGDDILNLKNNKVSIKIDVEGFEFHVLRGLIKLLSLNKCLIQIEVWEKNYDLVNNFLKKLNYKKLYMIDGDYYFTNFDIG